MTDVLTLCENCEKEPSIGVTDDDVDLCAACELACIDEMAAHEDGCMCDHSSTIDCLLCTCGVAGRVERRKAWLREQITKAQAAA